MEKHLKPRATDMHALHASEMKAIAGGSAVNWLIKLAEWGTGYFFNMGFEEGRSMRAKMKTNLNNS
jgi:hypothetical protein